MWASGRWLGTCFLALTLVAPRPCIAEPTDAETSDTVSSPPSAPAPLGTSSAAPFKLTNGLSVFVFENHREPQVAVVMSYATGLRDDPSGLEGLAHLVEHLTYRDSQHLAPYAGLALLQASGAVTVNGTTGTDSSTYYSLVPARALERALWVEAERLAFSLGRFDQSSLELERKIVANEIGLKRTLQADFETKTAAALLGDPSLESMLDPAQLDSVRLSDAQSFFQRGYRADNATLTFAGDVTPNVATALATKYFGDVRNPPGRFERRCPTVPTHGDARRIGVQTGAPLEQVLAEWALPPLRGRERVVDELLARVLAARLREAGTLPGTMPGVQVHLGTGDCHAILSLRVMLTPGAKHADVEARLGEALRRADDTETTRALALASREMQVHEVELLERPLDMALRNADLVRRGDGPLDIAREVELIRSVAVDDIIRAQLSLGPPLYSWLWRRRTRWNGRDE